MTGKHKPEELVGDGRAVVKGRAGFLFCDVALAEEDRVEACY